MPTTGNIVFFGLALPIGTPVRYAGNFGRSLPVAATIVGIDIEADGQLVYIVDIGGERRWGYPHQIEPAG